MIKIFKPISVRADVLSLSKEMFQKHLTADAVVYDIGCGQKPFAEFLKGKVKSHIGVDLADGFYQADKVDIIGTAYAVPAPDGCADAVISSQVIEHLETPLLAIAETHRLLRSGGLFFLSFPFLYPIHAAPRDFMRYTEFYIRQEVAANKFDIVDVQRIGGFWYLIGLYLSFYFQQMDRGVLKRFYIVKIITFLSNVFFRLIHEAEGALLKFFKKDVVDFRAKWTVNYVYALKKKDIGA